MTDRESQEQLFRRLEVEALARYLPAGGVALEVGGGTGWQAALLSRAGLSVLSVDLPDRERHAVHFPVADYDGLHLPASDASVEVIWSSSVMEHVVELDALSAEMARVAVAGGVAIHIMPTPSWRLWNSIGYPLAVVASRVRRAIPGAGRSNQPTSSAPARSRATKLRGLFLPGPHGAAPSALAELFLWRRQRWVDRLADDNWELVAAVPLRLFYSGNALATNLPLAARRVLSRVLGSVTCAYVLKRTGSR